MSFFKDRPLCASLAFFMAVYAALLLASAAVKTALLCAFVLSAVIYIAVRRRVASFCGLMAAGAAACFLSFLYFNVIVEGQISHIGFEGEIQAEIREISFASDYESTATVRITALGDEETDFLAKLTCEYFLDAEENDVVKLNGRVVELNDDPDGFNEKRYYRSKSIFVGIESESGGYSIAGKCGAGLRGFFSSVNRYCAGRLEKCMKNGGVEIVKAVFLGDRSELSPSFVRDFRRIGLTHLLCVSGMHLSILIGGIYSLLRVFKLHKKVRLLIIIPLCLFYMGFSGASPSILRSGIMFIMICIADLTGRFNDSATSLFISGVLIILFSPCTIYDAGFLLSFFATFGIITAMPLLRRREEKLRSRGRLRKATFRFVAAPFIITVFAVAFTLPLTAYYFGKINALTPLTNIVFAPLVTVILFLSPLTVLLSYIPYVGTAAGWVLSLFCKAVTNAASFTASLGAGSLSLSYPFVKYITAAVCVMAVVMLFMKVRHEAWYLLPLGTFMAVYLISRTVFLSQFDSYSYAACVNYGKNDAVCLYDEGRVTLIDISTGSKSFIYRAANIAEEEFYRDTVDCFVVTHYHGLIVGALDSLTSYRYVSNVLFCAPINEKEEEIFDRLTNICDEKGISYSVAEPGEAANAFGAAITAGHEYIKTSTHPAVYFTAELSGKDFMYAGSSYNAVCPEPDKADYIFFGSHHPKQKKNAVYPACTAAVYSSREAAELNTAESDEVYYISENDGRVTVRIKK